MKRPFARLFEIDGEHVLSYIDQVENSEGEQVWAIVTQFISEGGNVARLETSYSEEVELEDVMRHMFNEENDEQMEDAIRKTLKTLRSFYVEE